MGQVCLCVHLDSETFPVLLIFITVTALYHGDECAPAHVILSFLEYYTEGTHSTESI